MQALLFFGLAVSAMASPQRYLDNVDPAFYQPSAPYPGSNIGYRPPFGGEPISIGPEFVNPSFVTPGADPVHVVDNNVNIVDPAFYQPSAAYPPGSEPISIGPEFVNPSFVTPAADPVHVVDNNPSQGGPYIIPNPDPFFSQGGQSGSGYQPVSIGPTFVTGGRPPLYNPLLRNGK